MSQTTMQSPGERTPQRPAPPRHPRRSFARRLSQSAKLWARDTFSRDQLVNGLKSLAWVAPLTVIIWIYAEREQTAKQTVQFRIEARNADPNRIVELSVLGPDGKLTKNFTIRADLSGPQVGLDLVREKLEGGMALPIQIPDLPPGHSNLPNFLIDNADEFLKGGLAVSGQQPSVIDVYVDPIDARDVPVLLSPDVKNIESPSFTPPSIRVTGPKSVLDAAQGSGKLVAYAFANADVTIPKEPGEQTVPNVRLSIPFDKTHVTLSSAAVTATLTVKPTDKEDKIDSLPVSLNTPPNPIWNKYTPDPATTRSIQSLKVTGPPDVIALINNPEKGIKPWARLDLTTISPQPTNAPGILTQSYTAKIIYDFGSSGVKETSEAPKTMTFHLVERSSIPE